MAIELMISGMSCQHCVRAVTQAIESVAGVESTAVDLAAGQARVTGQVEAEALLAAVTAAGYEAELV